MCARRPMAIVLALHALCGCRDHYRQPAPKATSKVRIAVAAAQASAEGFDPEVERFADVQLLRYRVSGFDALSRRERKLLFYLQEAALSGRDILYAQRYPHNLAVRRTLETVLASYRGDRSTQAFVALQRYATRVWLAHGIHHPVSGHKMLPEDLTAADFAELVEHSDTRKLPLGPNQTLTQWLGRLTPVIFDPTVAPQVRAGENAWAADANSIAVDGRYGKALTAVVRWLKQAREVAAPGPPRETLDALIDHLTTGSPDALASYLEHMSNPPAPIGLLEGLVETSTPTSGGTFGALVSLDDRPSPRSKTLSQHVSWFEEHAPIDPAHRSTGAHTPHAHTLQAIASAGSSTPLFVLGVDTHLATTPLWSDHTQNVRNVREAYATARGDDDWLAELILSARERRRAREHGARARALFFDLHHIVGHAPYARAPDAAPVSSTLREYAAPLVEARADLLTLYFLFEPKLIDLHLIPSFEVARTAYDAYVRNALLLCLASLEPGERIHHPQVLAQRLIVHWARAQDPDRDPSVQRVLKDEKTYFHIADYMRLRRHVGRLLAEVQRILFEGDFETARKLVEQHGQPLEEPLHRQVKRRIAALRTATLYGFVQPRLVADHDGDRVTDVQLHYPKDFVHQQLADAQRYSLLPTYPK